ncbi:MAG: PQQ-dependent sugar dehydrogenase [Candidatus Promineifilaceae bacterium]
MKALPLNKSAREIVSFVCLLILAAVLITACSAIARASQDGSTTSSPGGGTLQLSLDPFATGLSGPVGLTNAGDSRLFAIEQAGRIRVIQSNGTVLPTPFLDISARVDSGGDELGLLGLAFHPNYASNGYFYVNYTNTTSGTRRTRISRFSVTGNPNVADPNSEVILLTVTQPFTNHNAGKINFGVDGYLYIPLGDGGSGGDPNNNAQTLTTLLGKITRIDVDSGPGVSPDCVGIGTGSYTIPNSNPLIDGAGSTCDEIWAIGFRNPYQSSFDRVTHDLYVGDVGQSNWEEVDHQPANSTGGENYGWRCYEGNHAYNTSGCLPMNNYTFPVFEYANEPGSSAIIGGHVYRGSIYPNMVGHYFLADSYSGDFWDLDTDNGWASTMHTNLTGCCYVSFGEDMNGEIYVVNRNGTIYHLEEATTGPTPTPSITPTSTNTPTPTATLPPFTPSVYKYIPVIENDN